jgi:hypothetical protein
MRVPQTVRSLARRPAAFLGGLLSILEGSEHPVAVLLKLPAVPLGQLSERVRVPGPRAGDQVGCHGVTSLHGTWPFPPQRASRAIPRMARQTGGRALLERLVCDRFHVHASDFRGLSGSGCLHTAVTPVAPETGRWDGLARDERILRGRGASPPTRRAPPARQPRRRASVPPRAGARNARGRPLPPAAAGRSKPRSSPRARHRLRTSIRGSREEQSPGRRDRDEGPFPHR